jgi:glycosyltransferase involved in cell wall biosynthesis
MGGVEFSTLYLASHLDRSRWLVTVVCPGEGPLASACRDAGVRVDVIPIPALLPTSLRLGKADTRLPNPLAWFWNVWVVLVAAFRLTQYLSRNTTDLAVTKGLYAHFSGGLACLLRRVRCIWHVQDFISERFGGAYRLLFGLVASILPDEIAADGTPIARQLPERIRKRVHVVLNGVDVQTFRPCHDSGAVRRGLGIPSDALVIGHAARLTPWKGQHHLVEAFGRIAARNPRARLLLVGSPMFDDDSYERRLRQRTDELGLDGRVIFAGFRTDLPQVLNAMDIFAYPSVEKDTSPLALLSALACGLPVAAFDIDGVREVLGDTGILTPVRDEHGLAEELEKLLGDPALRKNMGGQSRETAVKRFSLEAYVKGMETVFSLGSG